MWHCRGEWGKGICLRQITGAFTEFSRRRHASYELVHGRDKATKDQGLQGNAGTRGKSCHGRDALEHVIDVRPVPEDPLTGPVSLMLFQFPRVGSLTL